MFDVGVIGIGSVGSMALWQLALRGQRVVGFEQFTIGHDRGSAIGGRRLLRVISVGGEEYVSLMQTSVKMWKELEKKCHRKLLTENGIATIGREDLSDVADLLGMIETLDLDAEVLKNVSDRFPVLRVSKDDTAIIDKAGGALDSELSVVSAVRCARELGAHVRTRSRVISIEPDPAGVWIRTDDDAYRVDRLVVTAGAWIDHLLGPARSGIVSPRRMVAHRFPVLSGEPFRADLPPMVRLIEGEEFWIVPTDDGAFVEATAWDECWPLDSADALDRGTTFGDSARIRALLDRHCIGISTDPVRSTVHMDGFTSDARPIVGLLDDWPNVAVAVGFSGRGFGMAPAIGLALADLICDRTTSQPISFMRPTRRLKRTQSVPQDE